MSKVREQTHRSKRWVSLYRKPYEVTMPGMSVDAYELGRLRIKFLGIQLPLMFAWMYVVYITGLDRVTSNNFGRWFPGEQWNAILHPILWFRNQLEQEQRARQLAAKSREAMNGIA